MGFFIKKICLIRKVYYLCTQETFKQIEIMLYTKEFYEIMEGFEKYAKKLVSLGIQGLQKEPKENWDKQQYYCDGNANNAFKMFLFGVSFGKTL